MLQATIRTLNDIEIDVLKHRMVGGDRYILQDGLKVELELDINLDTALSEYGGSLENWL